MERTYENAIAALNTLQSNFATVEAIRKAGLSLNLQAMPEMLEWCRKLGYQPSDFNRLNPIHIAGTKGKGSTCAFISWILSQYLPSSDQPPAEGQRSLHKIGLFTSPHLRFVRERIQINNMPLSEAQFAKYFFETWDRLEAAAQVAGLDAKDPAAKPVYFRFLTLMAFHTYVQEGVDAAIIECGIGGEYDYTNILEKPLVTGITSLGIDHVPMLGTTIEEIAWQKAGIMKPGAVAYTAPQPQGAMKVLRDRATEKGVALQIATGHPEREPGNPAAIRLGLSGDVQYINAELAASVAGGFLRQLGFPDVPVDITTTVLPDKFRRGLETAKLSGRFDKRVEANVAWHIDGAHTLESIETTGKWYASETTKEAARDDEQGSTAPAPRKSPKFRVLIFNQQTRDSSSLARSLHKTLSEATGSCAFTHAVFCTNVTFKQAGYTPDLLSMNTSGTDVDKLSVQKNLAKEWKELSPDTEVAAMSTIEEAVDFVRNLAAGGGRTPEAPSRTDDVAVSVLVTGSLHLVGGLIDVIETIPGGGSD